MLPAHSSQESHALKSLGANQGNHSHGCDKLVHAFNWFFTLLLL